MKYHILNGDALAESFPPVEIPGQIVVIREAFVEGPLSIDFSLEFWDRRAAFVSSAYGAEEGEHDIQFTSQLRIMDDIKDDDEVCLWFEDDLFCQVNMWFAVSYIHRKVSANFYRVFPEEDKIHWSGFGKSDEKKLIEFFKSRRKMTEDDIRLAQELWNAYVMNDREKLKALSFADATCYRFLEEVISAHLERASGDEEPGRPQKTLIDILNAGKTNFYEICDEFWKKEGIYGFGDLQVFNMLKEIGIEFPEDMP